MHAPTPQEALKRAIETQRSARQFAMQIGVTPQALSQWRRVPVERVLDVERLSGVSRHDLRPDIYPRDGSP